MARLTLRHRLARVHPFVWIGAAAAVAGLIAWPLGGWETVELESTKIPQAAPGELVDGQQYAVRVDAAELTGVHPDGFSEPDPGWEYLVLTLDVTNMTAQTQLSLYLGDSYSGIVTLDGGVLGWGSTLTDADGYEVRSEVYLVTDDTYNPDLQPRLEAPIRLVFPVPIGTWTAGDTLVVGVVDRTPFQRTLSTGTGYGSATVVAEVDLVIAQGDPAPDHGEQEP
jgi:hypothetical protein